VAACFGAAVASAALVPKLGTHHAVSSAVRDVPDVSLSFPELDSASDNSDEVDNFEVSWPSPEEGVAP
jgi:hypothetical protein